MKRYKMHFAVDVKTTKVVRQIVNAKTPSEAREKVGLGAGRVAGSRKRVTLRRAEKLMKRGR